ncbi:hypothetical protein N2152v2_008391 [Parachlorella kessleri]
MGVENLLPQYRRPFVTTPAGSLDDEGSEGDQQPPKPQEPSALTVEDLKQLTELHVGNVYDLGIVSGAGDLAQRLGSSVQGGLDSDEAALDARRRLYGSNLLKAPQEATFLELVWEALQDFTIIILLVAGAASLGLELVINGGSTTSGGPAPALADPPAAAAAAAAAALSAAGAVAAAGSAAGVVDPAMGASAGSGSSSSGGGGGSWIEGASILASVVVVVMVTAVNNYQKERQFRELQEVHRDVKVRAIRDGRERRMSVFDVLVGDLLLVETGDILPVDGVLVEGSDIKVDESHLTGESDDVDKSPEAAQSLLSGSRVLSGFGRMLVTAVGPNSQAGQIAEMVAEGKVGAGKQGMDGLKEETMLQRKLASYATFIGKFGLAAAVLVMGIEGARFSYDTFWVQQLPWSWEYLDAYLRFFILGVTILVVAVPEGLPLAVTLSLAYSVKQMLADNNLVRHLSAAETMGTATVICSDKTGTLTQNNMVVSRLWLCGLMLPDLRPFMARKAKPLKTVLSRLGSSVGSYFDGSVGGSTGGSADDPQQQHLASLLGSGESTAPPTSASPSCLPSSAASERLTSGSTDSPDWVAEQGGRVLRRELVRRGVTERMLSLLGQALATNSTANVFRDTDGHWQKTGNRTEVALLTLGLVLGCDLQGERSRTVVVAQAPFSSERKRMSTVVCNAEARSNGSVSLRVFTKGAAELVLGMCGSQLGPHGEKRPLTHGDKRRLLREFTAGSQRVLCLAYQQLVLPSDALPFSAVSALSSSGSTQELSVFSSGDLSGEPFQHALPPGWDAAASLTDNMERDLVLIGMVGIEDPLRPEVPQAIQECQKAGITVKMLTGDNVQTAASIARQCGILPPQRSMERHASSSSSSSQVAETSSSSSSQGAETTSSSSNSNSSPGLLASRDTSAVAEPSGSQSEPQSLASITCEPDSNGASNSSRGRSLSTSAGAGGSDRSSSESGDEWAWQGAEEDGAIMEGSQFRERVLRGDGEIDGDAFREVWSKLRVLARCTPADKYTIVTGVKAFTDEVIAVTGDGTNDAPALRAANVGFAMNAGTDTAKEAADIVLLDNNFASIVSAVLWGRGVYANITRFLQFQLTINIVAVLVAVTGAVVSQDSPLTAVQMLWVNLIMDSLASLALATEPPQRQLLAIPPFSKEHEFVDPASPPVKHILGQALFQLAVMAALVFHPQLLGVPDHATLAGAPSEHYTIVFNAFVLMQLFNQVNARKILDSSVVWEGLPQATLFNSILGTELVLQYLIVQYGGLAFHTHPLTAAQWGICLGIGASTLVVRDLLRRLPYGKNFWEPVSK